MRALSKPKSGHLVSPQLSRQIAIADAIRLAISRLVLGMVTHGILCQNQTIRLMTTNINRWARSLAGVMGFLPFGHNINVLITDE